MATEPEPRRSVRSTKGQHKALDQLDQPIEPKPRKGKKGKKAAVEKSEEPEEEIIRCVCGATEQDEAVEEPWIACDKCGAWQHNICMGMSIYSEDLNDVYFCEQCKPENHKELLDGVARGERPWEARRDAHEQEVREEEAAEQKRKKGGKKKGAKRQSVEPKSSQKSTKASASPAPVPEKKAPGAKSANADRKRNRDASADTTSKVCLSSSSSHFEELLY